jgi:hypothetical protein
VLLHLRAVFPDSDVQLADDRREPWSRAASIDSAVRTARHEVVVVCDADLLVPHAQLWHAVALAAAARGQVVPFDVYRYTTSAATLRVTYDPAFDWLLADAAWDYRSSVGGAGVFSRETWLCAGGHDPRFRGWGWQDRAFAAATHTLAGPLRRTTGPAVHLWHPTDPSNVDGHPTLDANSELGRRYVAASGDADAMRALVAERAMPT